MMKTILVIDDEIKICEVISSFLETEGYRVIAAQSGLTGLSYFRKESIDLVILDLMLPDISGEEVCKQIRQQSSVPVLMLTAKVSEDDSVRGLSIGADDYVIKPFSLRELAARIKVILRRSGEDSLLADHISFHAGELEINTPKHEVHKNGEMINLTPNEYKLLLILARHPGRTFTRDELIEKVLGLEYEGDVRTIDQHIKNIRQKIEMDSKQPRIIITVFGVGYRFIGGMNS
jgi:two-component system response regulator ResD